MNENLGKLCLPIEINSKNYMLSHTTWAIHGLIELIKTDKPLIDTGDTKKESSSLPTEDEANQQTVAQIIKIKMPTTTRPSDTEPTQIEPITKST